MDENIEARMELIFKCVEETNNELKGLEDERAFLIKKLSDLENKKTKLLEGKYQTLVGIVAAHGYETSQAKDIMSRNDAVQHEADKMKICTRVCPVAPRNVGESCSNGKTELFTEYCSSAPIPSPISNTQIDDDLDPSMFDSSFDSN